MCPCRITRITRLAEQHGAGGQVLVGVELAAGLLDVLDVVESDADDLARTKGCAQGHVAEGVADLGGPVRAPLDGRADLGVQLRTGPHVVDESGGHVNGAAQCRLLVDDRVVIDEHAEHGLGGC